MASLLNNASLLLNPAGSIISYQEDKIYSVLPKNGAGDFTFSGGDGGTRVNQQGYIEQTPANFMLNSGTTWTPYNVTVTTGITDPVGGTGAYTIGSIASGNITDYGNKGTNAMSLPAGTVITLSIYMKGSGTIATYLERAIAGTYWFDVKTHTLSSEWQVFTHSYTVPTDASGVGIYVGNATGTTATSVDIAFPMLNYGSTAKPYQPTTDRLNYPRITYQNGRGALLSEPQRVNLLTYSNVLSGQSWVPYRSTYTANAIASPDGTTNAALTVWDGVSDSSTGYYNTNITFAGSTTYCLSAFLKYYNKPIVNLGYADRSSPYLGGGANFNLANGTFVSLEGDATSGIIEPYKDGWYKCTVIFTTVSSPSYNYVALNCDVDNAGEGFYTYGTQLEVGSFPTSYIPTTSATVTRPTDSTSNATSFQTTGLASNGAWSLILEGSEVNTTAQGFQYYSGGTYLGGHYGSTFIVINSSGGETYPFSLTQPRFRVGLSWNGTTLNAYENGISVLSTTNVLSAYNTFSTLLLNNGGGSKFSYPKAAVYSTALSTAQLQELTTYRSGSGGNISYYGPYTIHTFQGSGTFTPSFTGPVEVLVVAGGGGGGNNHAGGGGAGGLLYTSAYGVSAGTSITVTIGAGGTSPVSNPDPVTNGSNSVFGGLTAIGGGGGGNRNDFNNNSPGGNGGSGGGGGGSQSFVPLNRVPGTGVPGQGNNGGEAIDIYGGGGGGAGAVGTTGAASSTGGNGGNGLPYSISGFSTYYAGGGGGGYCPIAGGGNGGLGGGGKGGILVTDKGTPGVPYTGAGGGGGGAGGTQGSIGGAGIVIVRYLT